MASALLITSLGEEGRKKDLRASIARRRKILLEKTEKVESLRISLETVRREYLFRVGRLFLQDDQLDGEIFKHRKLLGFLRSGCTLEEAEKRIENMIKSNNEYPFGPDIKVDFEYENVSNNSEQNGGIKDLKQLWKKLLRKLHPDLTLDSKEKERREKIIKEINKAYEANDLVLLQSIEGKHVHHEKTPDMTTREMEELLLTIENAIIGQENEFRRLRKSEWYFWKVKSDLARKKKEDVFFELEERLTDSIIRKSRVVEQLKKTIQKMSDPFFVSEM